jgi:hypothetical protein
VVIHYAGNASKESLHFTLYLRLHTTWPHARGNTFLSISFLSFSYLPFAVAKATQSLQKSKFAFHPPASTYSHPTTDPIDFPLPQAAPCSSYRSYPTILPLPNIVRASPSALPRHNSVRNPTCQIRIVISTKPRLLLSILAILSACSSPTVTGALVSVAIASGPGKILLVRVAVADLVGGLA